MADGKPSGRRLTPAVDGVDLTDAIKRIKLEPSALPEQSEPYSVVVRFFDVDDPDPEVLEALRPWMP